MTRESGINVNKKRKCQFEKGHFNVIQICYRQFDANYEKKGS